MTTTPGWYDDGQGNTRWWDGTAWTDQIAPTQPAPTQPATPAVPVTPVAEPVAGLAAPVEPAAAQFAPAAGKKSRTKIFAIAGISSIAIIALVATLLLTGVFRSDEARMEKALNQWFTAIDDNDLSTFEKLTHPSAIEDSIADNLGDLLEEMREYSSYGLLGVEKVEFSTTDVDATIREIDKRSGAQNSDEELTEQISESREYFREIGLDPDKMGFMIFRGKFSAKTLEAEPEIAEGSWVVLFDLDNNSAPRIIGVERV